MKRTLSFMVMALALLLTQCRKPEVKFPTPSSAEGVTVSMTVTAGPGSKTDITDEGTITWSKGDKLYVGDGEKYIGFLTLVGDGGSATGTFTGNVTLPTGTTDGGKEFRFFYLGSTPPEVSIGANSAIVSFASQDIYKNGDKLENAGKHHVGYGTANGTVAGGKVTGINVTLVSKVALARFSFKKGGTDYTDELTLSGDKIYSSMTVGFDGTFVGTSGSTTSGISLTGSHSERYVMLVPVGTDSETLSFAGDGVLGSTTLGSGIEANKFYGKTEPIPVNLTAPSYLPGDFTVSSGVTVKFSKGNLQYLGKSDGTGTWRFAEHQWDYMGDGPKTTTGNKGNVDLGADYEGKYNTGSGNAGGSETEADKAAARDLFGWGCTGYQDTREVNHTNWYQTNYRPYSTSKENVGDSDPAYNINRYGYGPDYYDGSKYGLTVENNSDWGCVPGLPLAGGGKTWRTLSIDEWDYLMNTREASTIGSTSNARYAEVKVNGVCGLMLFPDTFTWPSDVTPKPSRINTYSTTSWNGCNYSQAAFGTLESAGVVFLPGAGCRQGSSFTMVGTYGLYWSSTCSTCERAYYVDFMSSSVTAQFDFRRFGGFSVRLVR